MKIPALVILALALLSGCDFMRGARDEGARQLAQLAADEVNRRLEGDLKDVAREVIAGVRDEIPNRGPVGDGLLYSAGGLLAYILGSYGKGKIREARERAANGDSKT